jgi:homoserine kinase type II
MTAGDTSPRHSIWDPRPDPSPDLFEALRERYHLNPVSCIRDLGGSFNLNLLLKTVEGRSVVRVYGAHTDPARLAEIASARRHLAAGGVPSPHTLLTRDGREAISVNGRLVEVERYVEHDANMNTWPRLETGLPFLGRTHSLLLTLPTGPSAREPRFANHIEAGRALPATLEGVRRMRSWNPTEDELALAASFEELAHLVHEAEQDVAALPRQLVHGDFWDNNVLFHKGSVILVTDLDFMGERPRIDDLALTLYFANSSIGGDRLSETRIRQLRALVDAYDSGLTEPLSRRERRAIPAAIARQTLWAIGRWVVELPDTETARAHAAYRAGDVEWTLGLMRDLDHWQDAFMS